MASGSRRRKRYLGFLLVGLCVTLAAIASSAFADAPEPAFVSLGEGHIGNYRWFSEVEPPEDPGERKAGAICLGVGMLEPPIGTHNGEISETTECGPQSAGMPTIESITGGSKGKPRTAVAMLFDGSARRMYLKLRGRSGETFRLGRLSEEALGPISAQPLAYFTHGYASRFCIQRLVAYDQAGKVVAEDPGHPGEGCT